jgi:HEAT repeat protein
VQPLLVELERFAKEPDDKLQASALSALGSFGELAADARPLVLTALQSNDTGVRISACHALGAFRQEPEASIPLLVELARTDPDEFVRSSAIRAAAMFGEVGLPFCGPLRAQVEQAIQEREQHERLWQRPNPK